MHPHVFIGLLGSSYALSLATSFLAPVTSGSSMISPSGADYSVELPSLSSSTGVNTNHPNNINSNSNMTSTGSNSTMVMIIVALVFVLCIIIGITRVYIIRQRKRIACLPDGSNSINAIPTKLPITPSAVTNGSRSMVYATNTTGDSNSNGITNDINTVEQMISPSMTCPSPLIIEAPTIPTHGSNSPTPHSSSSASGSGGINTLISALPNGGITIMESDDAIISSGSNTCPTPTTVVVGSHHRQHYQHQHSYVRSPQRSPSSTLSASSSVPSSPVVIKTPTNGNGNGSQLPLTPSPAAARRHVW
jgi:hypothetical protein